MSRPRFSYYGSGTLPICSMGYYVMTTFYPYQWDLNYAPFNDMYNFLFLYRA